MAWQQANTDQYNAYHRQYTSWNLDHIRRLLKAGAVVFERTTYKKKRVIQATPAWVDTYGIHRIYEYCVDLSKSMQLPLVVDHIVPISNPNVCGLHVPENLQVISQKLAKLKGNKFNHEVAEYDLMKWLMENGKTNKTLTRANR